MTTGYYREFWALEEVSIKIMRELRNKPIEARLHLKSYIQGGHDLIVVRPRISSQVPCTITQLSVSLSADQVNGIKVFGQPPRDAAPDQGLSWRIEIWKKDNQIVIIRCSDIKGLPDYAGTNNRDIPSGARAKFRHM